MEHLNGFISWFTQQASLMLAFGIVALLIAAWLADFLTRRFLLSLMARIVRATPMKWDDVLLDRGVIASVAHVIPAIVIYYGMPLLAELSATLINLIRSLAIAYIIFTIAQALSRLLSSVNAIYTREQPERARQRPIKGYVQLLQLVIYVLAAVLIISALIERSPLLLLSGLGAMTAVLLLIFKDTLMSLVAGIQLSSHDMLRVGDWIEMPQLNADGDVIDIALHTVKVQNFDRTITSIPTHRLITDSFRNWRGMSESGGRRIKRSISIDQGSVRFLDNEERSHFRRFALIDDYLQQKRAELEEWNAALLAEGKDPVNTRRVTNLGTFRAYAQAYIEHHPRIHTEMTRMVRQLPSGATGIPLEIYCFTATTAWAEYEGIQGDLFDHFIAVLPEFGLRLFQQPSGADFGAAASQIGKQ